MIPASSDRLDRSRIPQFRNVWREYHTAKSVRHKDLPNAKFLFRRIEIPLVKMTRDPTSVEKVAPRVHRFSEVMRVESYRKPIDKALLFENMVFSLN